MIYEDKNGKAVVAGILSIVPPDCLNPPSDLITTNVYNFYGTVVPCSSATPFYAIFAATSFFTFFFLGKVCTANNIPCVFPFKFRGEEFFKCTDRWSKGMCKPLYCNHDFHYWSIIKKTILCNKIALLQTPLPKWD